MSKKSKKKLKKAAEELAQQILHIYWECYEPEPMRDRDGNLNSDKSYYNGMIDGFTFALTLIDKKAIPLLPQAIVTEPYELVYEEDNDVNYEEVESGIYL